MMTNAIWRRRIAVTVIALGVVAALVYGFWPQPVPVEVAAVTRGPLRVTVDEEGKTRVRDRFVVSAPVAGIAQRVELDVGDAVQAGQAMLAIEPLRPTVLDPRTRAAAEARVAAAQAALNSAEEKAAAAKADSEHAQHEFQRIKKLCEVQCVSQSDLEHAQAAARVTAANHRSANFAVEVARYDLAAARTALDVTAAERKPGQLEQVLVRAPIGGRVLKIQHRSEGAVSSGEPLIDIGDPHALEVEVEVLSEDAVRIKPGTRVLFERWGGPETLQGVVRVVEPVGFTKVSALGVEEQRVLVIADITSPPEQWARLGDGYRVEASFILWEGQDVLQIPASALFRVGGGWAVFAVHNGRARRQSVELGERNGLVAQVLKGLQVGERVITHPSDAVDDGTRVAAQTL